MYYENKKQFYIKQYGPAIAIIAVSLVLIISGIYLSLNSNTLPKEQQVAEGKNNPPIVNETVETDANKPVSFAESGKVKNINGLAVVVETEAGTIEINLIGIEQNKKYPNLSTKIEEELKGKDIKIGYDNEKLENNKIYGYIYLNDKLYNATLLENGYAELRTERTNINKLDQLAAAQMKARKNCAGIWAY